MPNPREMIMRRGCNRKAASTQASRVSPAPIPMSAAAPAQPKPVSTIKPGHSIYSSIMNDHDRMGTRHLK